MLQHKLYARKDYDSDIKGNPIKLLDAIEEHSMSYYVENWYKVATVLESMKNFINLKQKQDEELSDYTLRFKSARDIMQSHLGGRLRIKKLAETQTRWDSKDGAQNEAQYKSAYESFILLLYLENADRTKYGTIISGLATQFSLG